MRVQHIQTLKRAGETVFPHKFHVSLSLRDFVDKYSFLQPNETNEDVVSVAGRELWFLWSQTLDIFF